MKRLRRVFPAACGFCLAVALAAGPAAAATPPICEFTGVSFVDPSAKPAVGEKYALWLTLTHPDSQYFGQAVSVSATVDWGDGSVETTSPRNFGQRFGSPTFGGNLEHAWARPGKYVVKILKATANGQSCPLGFAGWAAAFPLTVTVREGVAQAVHAVPSSGAAALAQKKAVFVPTPTPTPASVSATSRKAKAFVPTPTPIKTYSIPR